MSASNISNPYPNSDDENYHYPDNEPDQIQPQEQNQEQDQAREGVIKVKTLAQAIRTREMSYYGEKAFARMCLVFEANIMADEYDGDGHNDQESEPGSGDDLTRQMVRLLKRLGQSDPAHTDGLFWQLALVWLDARGWGELGLEALNLRIKLFQNFEL